MSRILLAILGVMVLLLASCASPVLVQPSLPTQSKPEGSSVLVQPSPSNEIVVITIMNNGISTDSSEVVVRNFHAGARAEMVYRVVNASSKEIVPEIYLNTSANVLDYSKAGGAIKSPEYVNSWIEIPYIVLPIMPAEARDYIVALQMPEEALKPAEKMGFQIGVAGKVEGGLQPAVGVWWIINFR